MYSNSNRGSFIISKSYLGAQAPQHAAQEHAAQAAQEHAAQAAQEHAAQEHAAQQEGDGFAQQLLPPQVAQTL
jgi:hypothetical protein